EKAGKTEAVESSGAGGSMGAAAEPTRESPEQSRSAGSERPAQDIVRDVPALAGFYGTPTEVPGLEASGLIYLPDLDKFLVVSDESEKNRVLYLMDSSARIEKSMHIRGLDKMNDMEAIAADSTGALFVLSSQRRTKKGKLPEKRTLLARVSRKGEILELKQKVRLYDLLESAARLNPGDEWARFLRVGISEGTLDI